jgi:hypothetical protein
MIMIYLVGIAMYANPFLLLTVWIKRLKPFHNDGLRIRLGWISLILASLGFISFFGGMFLDGKPGTPAFDRWFKRWFWVCSSISITTFTIGLFGKGKMQWAVVLSAFLTPMSCVLQKILE